MTTPEQSFLRYRERGDVKALGEVFDAVAAELGIVAAHVAPHGVEPEDLVQATFVTAIESRQHWDAARPLVPWLIGILVNHARRERQREARRPEPDRLTQRELPGPLDVAEMQEVGERIGDALKRLPRHHRQALTLRLVHGLTPTQIATALGCPLTTCKSRLQRGLEQLRRGLPASIGASLAAFLVTGKGLAAARQASLTRAVASVSSTTATTTAVAIPAGLTLVLMKPTLATACAIALAVTAWFVWPRSPAAEAEGSASRTAHAAAAVPDPRADTAQPSTPTRTLVAGNEHAVARPPSGRDVRGRVVDELGNGLADVSAALGRASPNNEFSHIDHFRRDLALNSDITLPSERLARTGADGRFRFGAALREEGSVVGIWSPSRGAAIAPVPETLDQELVLVLPDHGQLFGRVLDENGLPVRGVLVSVYPAASGMPSATAQSDADGRYRTVPLPPGKYRIAGLSPRHAWTTVEADLRLDDRQVDLALEPLPVLSALLVDSSGEPWTGARIESACGVDPARLEVLATPHSCARRSDAAGGGRGERLVPLDPATGRVQGPILDGPLAFLSLWWRGVRLGEAPLAGPGTDRIVIRLTRPEAATLRVRLSFDPQPDRVPRSTLRLDRPSGLFASALENELTTTIDGFETVLTVPASDVATSWWLHAQADGYALSDQLVVWPAGMEPVVCNVSLSHATRSLDGVVIGMGGKPLEAAEIRVIAADGSFVARRERVTARSDRDGAFHVKDLPLRALRVLVDADERGMAVLDVAADAAMPLRVTVRAARLFRVGPIGLPERVGAQLRVLDGSGRTIVDDRIAGCVRTGERLSVRAPGDPRRFEAFVPGAPAPFAQGERVGDAEVVTLQPTTR